MTILKKIDEAIDKGLLNPERITPADLRRIGIDINTSSVYLSNNTKHFERIEKGVYRRRRRIIRWTLDDRPITVELYPSVIKIYDKKNIIYVDKRKGRFNLELHGMYEFGESKRKGL